MTVQQLPVFFILQSKSITSAAIPDCSETSTRVKSLKWETRPSQTTCQWPYHDRRTSSAQLKLNIAKYQTRTVERNCNVQSEEVSNSLHLAAPPPGHRSGGRRSRTALIRLLHLRVTAQEGRGQIDLAPPPHLRGSLLHGDWEVEQPCFLVGNNQLTSPTPYTPYYYLPELVMLNRK